MTEPHSHARARVTVRGLRVAHGGTAVLDGLELDLEPGTLHTVLGPSGAGKSTVVHALTGMLPRTAQIDGTAVLQTGTERVDLLNAPPRVLRRQVRGRLLGTAPQGSGSVFTPTRTIGAQLREAARTGGPAGVRLGVGHPHRWAGSQDEHLAELAHTAGVEPGWLARYPHELSGGQLSRLGVVAAMVNHPPVLLADEPTAGLDAEASQVVATALRTYAHSGHAVLVITHDRDLAARYADRVTLLEHGRVAAQGPAPAVLRTTAPVHRAHRRAAAAAAEDRVRGRGIGVRRGGHVVLQDLHLGVPAGTIVGLTGPSGVGKSTAASVLALLEAPDTGVVELGGERVDGAGLALDPAIRRRVAWVSQHPHTAVDPRLSLRTAITLPARLAGKSVDVPGLAARCGLGAALLDRRPHQVSGGELQRACVARALALEPAALVLDEITAMLDDGTAADVLRVLRDQADRTGAGALLISHNLAELSGVADTVLALENTAVGARLTRWPTAEHSDTDAEAGA